jgi:hypothetical protein
MFKFNITLDRHNAGQKFNCCLRFDLPNLSLPSTFNLHPSVNILFFYFQISTHNLQSALIVNVLRVLK